MKALLSPRDAGRLIGVTSSRLAQLDREGKLRAVRDSRVGASTARPT